MPVKILPLGRVHKKYDTQPIAQFFASLEEPVEPQLIKRTVEVLKGTNPYNKRIVGAEEFCESRYYMYAVNPDGSKIVYPEILKAIKEISEGGYEEVVLTGGIGSGKTTTALYCLAYQLYLMSCIDNPHQLLGLDSASEIVMIFQSLNARVATGVDYMRFQSMIDRSPYFQKYFPYDTGRKSDMRFPNRIVVTPTTTTVSGAIGQNIWSGLIDEINFMSLIDKSKQTVDGGAFDQAKMIYDTIDRRRKTRFMRQGKMPGLLCLSSSKHYPGEFTDQKEEEAKHELSRYGRTTIYVYHKRVWDVKPHDYLGSKRFHVFVGSENKKPRIMEEGERVLKSDLALIDEVPIEYLSKYESDIYAALRDISGVANAARHPFIADTESIAACFGKVEPILSHEETNFESDGVVFYPKLFLRPEVPRWVHIDLGQYSDGAGVTCGYVDKFVKIDRGDAEEILPHINTDFTLRVVPPKGGEILFFKIRALIYKLKAAGLNIRWVSLDSFQSADTIQMMRQKHYITGQISMDKSTVPYDLTKAAIYDQRLSLAEHKFMRKELGALERDAQKGKIDHPAYGSKDCSDSLAGVVYGLTTRRELWVQHSVSSKKIPESIVSAMQKEKERRRAIEGLDGEGDEGIRRPKPWERPKGPS